MGNPPYAGASQNTGDIDGLTKKAYAPTGETKLNWDDYVKFIRFAHHKKMESVDKGVIGIITSNTFLNAVTLRKMRNRLMQDFNAIYILNLHGNSLIGETTPDGKPDKNVFDIRVGVAITFLVKTGEQSKNCNVSYASIQSSTKRDKWKRIRQSDMTIFKPLDVAGFNQTFAQTRWSKHFVEHLSLFVPMEDEGRQLIPKYGDCWGVTDIFQQYGSGVKTERDHICIHQKQEDIEAVIHDFLTLSENELDEKYQKPYNKSDSRDWSIGKAKADIIEKHKDRGKDLYKDILYRPFDFRKTCYTGTSRGFIGTPGTKIGQHMIGGANYALLSKRSRVLKAETEYSHFGICDSVSDLNYIGDQTYCCPLYLYPPLNGEGVLLSATKKEENFQPDFRKWLDKKYGKKYTPEQVLGYIYGVLHSPVFRTRYQELLKIDFPRIPFVDAARQFEAVSALGWELVQAHLMKKVPDGLSVVLKGEGKNTVEKMGYVEGRHELHINKDQHFINIPPEAWNFTIGGYQVLEKYLKERKQAGRPLGLAELRHIPNVVRILAWTHQKMQDIDTIFDCS